MSDTDPDALRFERRFGVPRYLRAGTPRQQAAYAMLAGLAIFTTLAPFQPVLAGTIPLDIDIPGSDLDLVCRADDLEAFLQAVRAAHGDQDGFAERRAHHQGLPSAIVGFRAGGFPVQLFAQRRAVREQRAFRHLIAAARLLDLAGDAARLAIRELKLSGMKTEPAFCRYFALAGDPYAMLLDLAGAPRAVLDAIVRRAAHLPGAPPD